MSSNDNNLYELIKLNPKNIRGVFFDIDETFSTQGKITAEAYSALWDLKNAGKVVVPITGRPAGWCDLIARMWPVNAVIGENGAFYFMMKNGKMEKHYTADPLTADAYKRELSAIQHEVLEKIPRAGIASDQRYREFDLAIDFCEDVKSLSAREIDAITELFERHGAHVKVSSIHVNGWFGDYDKLTAAKIFVKNELGLNLDEANEEFVFCGDSPNDEPMFEFFKNSVGVANVIDFKDRLKTMPAFITSRKSGAGFAELARHLLNL